MSPAHVLEPTYEALKRRLMTGAFAAGQRLEALRLADELGVSMTPVRDCLARLAAERLVDFVHGEGFRVPRMSEAELKDLFELQLILLLAALAGDRGGGVPGPAHALLDQAELGAPNQDASAAHAARLARLFLRLARRSGNAELVLAVAAIGDRLNLARIHLAALNPAADAEADDMEAAADDASAAALRAMLIRHHMHGGGESAALVRLMSVPRG